MYVDIYLAKVPLPSSKNLAFNYNSSPSTIRNEKVCLQILLFASRSVKFTVFCGFYTKFEMDPSLLQLAFEKSNLFLKISICLNSDTFGAIVF